MYYYVKRFNWLEMNFFKETKKKYRKVEMHREDKENMNMIIDDIKRYFNNEIVGRTKQVNIRFGLLFRGFIMKY